MFANIAAENLDKTKVTGVEPVDNLQDGVNSLASGQLGQGGILQPAGDMTSKEAVNRAERKGKDDSGSYIPGASSAGNAASGVADGGKAAASSAASGVKSAGGFLSGALGGGQKQERQNKDQQ